MLEAVRVRLDPSAVQERRLRSHVGAARFAYNTALRLVKAQLSQRDAERSYGVPDEDLTPLQGWHRFGWHAWWKTSRDSLAPWHQENALDAYRSGLNSLADGLKAWSDSRSGKRKGRKVGFPKFRKRGHRDSFSYSTHFRVADPYGVYLPRIGRVHSFQKLTDRLPDGTRILRVTVSESAGHWFAAFTIEREHTPPLRRDRGRVVGVDLGVKTLATLSTGEVIPAPGHLRTAERKLARLGREHARRQKGSNGRAHTVRRIARAHERVRNLRADALHKLTTRLVHEFDHVVIEDLHVAGMLTTPKPVPDLEHPGGFLPNGAARKAGFNKKLSDASFAMFRAQLEYKTQKHGTRLTIVDRWTPSSKTCSNCGAVKAKLALSERVFECEHCGHTLDRDLNAARNLQHLAGGGPESQNGNRHATPQRCDMNDVATAHRPHRSRKTRTLSPQEESTTQTVGTKANPTEK